MPVARLILVLFLAALAPAATFAADLAAGTTWRGPIPAGDTAPVPEGNFFLPVAAFGGGVHLLVFQRDGHLVFTRLDAEGNLLDPYPVTVAAVFDHSAKVAFNGTRFLVVWREGEGTRVSGRYILPDGSLDGEVLTLGTAYSEEPRIASNSDTFLVTLSPTEMMLISSTGGSRRVQAPNFSTSDRVVAVASDGESYFLLIYLRRLAKTPLLLRVRDDATAMPLPITPDGSSTIAWTGENLVVITTEPVVLRGYVLSSEGELVSGPHELASEGYGVIHRTIADARGGVLIAGNEGRLLRWRPDSMPVALESRGWEHPLTSASGRPLLVFTSSSTVEHRFLEADNSFSPAKPSLTAAARQGAAEMASTPNGWFSVWQEQRGSQRVISGAVLSRSLATHKLFDIGRGSREAHPSVAVGPASVLVVWIDGISGEGVKGRRYTHTGEPLDDEPFVIAADGGFTRQGRSITQDTIPVVWNGRYFLVVSPRRGMETLAATRITAGGSVLDPDGIPLPVSGRDLALRHQVAMAVSGSSTVVVWEDGGSFEDCQITCYDPSPPSRIESVRLDIEGNPLSSTPVVLSNAGETDRAPAIASAGERLLVVWTRGDGRAGARLVGPDGVPLAEVLEFGDQNVGRGTNGRVSITAVDDTFLVVRDVGSYNSNLGLKGHLISTEGAIVSEFQLPAEISTWAAPLASVHSSGSDVVVVYGHRNLELGGVRRNLMLTNHDPSAVQLAISIITSSATAYTGSEIVYTVTVSNTGGSTATAVMMEDILPEGLQFVSATASQGTCNAASPLLCNLGSLAAGASATVSLTTRVLALAGTISNTATVNSAEASAAVAATTQSIHVAAALATPTLSEWMLIALAGCLAMTAALQLSGRS